MSKFRVGDTVRIRELQYPSDALKEGMIGVVTWVTDSPLLLNMDTGVDFGLNDFTTGMGFTSEELELVEE